MKCSVNELYRKDVINIYSGCRIGYVNDIEIDTENGSLLSISVTCSGKQIFARHNDINICWNDIAVIGKEAILVKYEVKEQTEEKSNKKLFDLFIK